MRVEPKFLEVSCHVDFALLEPVSCWDTYECCLRYSRENKFASETEALAFLGRLKKALALIDLLVDE